MMMKPHIYYSTLLILILSTHLSFAQDDVVLAPKKSYFKAQIGGTATFITSKHSHYKAGGGFWLAFSQSLKNTNKIELGAQFDYNFMSSSSIEFDDGDDYFSNRGSLFRLNMTSSYHPLRLKHLDIYPEFQLGGAFNVVSSSYFQDQYEEDGNTEKIVFSPAINAGLGFGLDFRRVSLKVLYHHTTRIKQVDIKNISYQNELIYPQSKEALGGISIHLGFFIND